MSPTITRVYQIREVIPLDLDDARTLTEEFSFTENLVTITELVRTPSDSLAFVDNLDYTLNDASPAENPAAFPEAEGQGAAATVGELT